MNEAPVKSRTATEQASTHFSGGSVLCGGSLSSADMRLCNNKFWVLQSKSVAQRVWEEARHIGVEGTKKDEVNMSSKSYPAKPCLATGIFESVE
ncbi:hypothetical protein JHK87_043722 [Glycine soja]|nr:hypothetical protein JHK87_043722 [Glycine soja]